MTSDPSEQAATGLDEEAVAAFLRENPAFFRRHPELLETIEVPHRPGAGAVSLIERQVQRLRDRNERLEARLTELLRTARDNERVGARLLVLGRALLEADSLDATLATVRETLISEFAAEEAVVRLVDDGDGALAARQPERYWRPDEPPMDAFAELLERGEPLCGAVPEAQRRALFGSDPAATGSCAVVPLRAARPLGVMGLASHDPSRFAADAGTLFLGQLGELVSAGIARHTEPG